MQRRLDPETDVNKPFENISCQGRIQNFFREGVLIFVTFSSVIFFSAELILSNVSTKNNSRGVRGHRPTPPEMFQNLHICTVAAILALFEQFLGKVRHIFGS